MNETENEVMENREFHVFGLFVCPLYNGVKYLQEQYSSYYAPYAC
jgi:hypothetical protein